MRSSSVGAASLSKYRIPLHSLTFTYKIIHFRAGLFYPMIPSAFVLKSHLLKHFYSLGLCWLYFKLTSTYLSVNLFQEHLLSLPEVQVFDSQSSSATHPSRLSLATVTESIWDPQEQHDKILFVCYFWLSFLFLCSSGLVQQ